MRNQTLPPPGSTALSEQDINFHKRAGGKGVISEMGLNSGAPELAARRGRPGSPGLVVPSTAAAADEKLLQVGAGESPDCKHLLPVA